MGHALNLRLEGAVSSHADEIHPRGPVSGFTLLALALLVGVVWFALDKQTARSCGVLIVMLALVIAAIAWFVAQKISG